MPTGGGTGGASGGKSIDRQLFDRLQAGMRNNVHKRAIEAEAKLKAGDMVKVGPGAWEMRPGVEDINAGWKEAETEAANANNVEEDRLYGAGASTRPGWGI